MAKKMGRPRKEIDKQKFETLCAIFCTEEEIANIFDCSIDTVNNWCKRTYKATFSEVYKKKSSTGKMSLRRMQYKAAEAGNVSMLIWLGKQYLGQKEQQETTISDSNISFTIKPATERPADE